VKLVVALGGHALAPRAAASLEEQRAAVARAAASLAAIAPAHSLVVVHGNGPQVGWLAAQAAASGEAPPLDLLDAESEGMLGYWLEQELRDALPGVEVAALLTQVEVDARDPAFAAPSKPIGRVLSDRETEALRARGIAVLRDRGGWRRAVASPLPLRILELRAIEILARQGVLVICAGGGGIPVVRDAEGRHRGVEAVIDKDRSALLLAQALGAEGLLLLTDVPAVYADWPGRERPIRRAAPEALRAQRFDAGSMGPKVEAACAFTSTSRASAWIGAVEDAAAILRGEAGTRLAPGSEAIEFWRASKRA
jgi:carbamate kinase